MIKKEFRKEWMHGTAVSSLKGRLRLNVPGLEFLFEERNEVAQALAKIAGVQRVRVTPRIGSVLLEYDEQRTAASEVLNQTNLVMARYAMNANRVRHSDEKGESTMTVKRLVGRLAVNAAGFLLGNTVFKGSLFGNKLGIINSIPALCSIGLSAPMVRGAWEGLKKDLRPNADFLTVTSIVASLMLGNGNSALMILALSDIAELMTSYTIEKTRASIKQMLSVETGDVWKVLEDGRLEKTSIDKIQAEDTLEIHSGEKIAVDGVVVQGSAVIDQSAITGEFVPAEKHPGDEVFAGTVMKSGNIRVRAARVGDKTVVSRIVKMVESSELKKAPIQRYADQFSNYLVPLNFLLCLVVWLATHNPQKALKMLVIDYSCGIKLSTATAFSAAVNAAVRKGILIKGGAYIEQMSGANTVLLDKTGTITEGKPHIVSMQVVVPDMTEKEVLSMAMAAEETSSHPLASAILAYGRSMGAEIPEHDEIITEVSRGSRTVVDGEVVRVGSLKFMKENHVAAPDGMQISGVGIANYVGVGSRIVGVLYAMDEVRQNVRRAINSLRYEGVGEVQMLTGDMDEQARLVAQEIGADGYRAQLLPEQKADAVLKLQTQGNGVVMVGDGINDAPALAYADVGISMGSKSTDIAMETSDVVINKDDPMTLPALRRLSSETMKIVHQNFAMVIGVNTVGLILGAASGISVMMSAVLHNLSTILVVGNSLRLMVFPPMEE